MHCVGGQYRSALTTNCRLAASGSCHRTHRADLTACHGSGCEPAFLNQIMRSPDMSLFRSSARGSHTASVSAANGSRSCNACVPASTRTWWEWRAGAGALAGTVGGRQGSQRATSQANASNSESFDLEAVDFLDVPGHRDAIIRREDHRCSSWSGCARANFGRLCMQALQGMYATCETQVRDGRRQMAHAASSCAPQMRGRLQFTIRRDRRLARRVLMQERGSRPWPEWALRCRCAGATRISSVVIIF